MMIIGNNVNKNNWNILIHKYDDFNEKDKNICD